ncbi:hypothetical protein UT300019_24520 [Clostridium sp. CTA-19]
MLREICIDKRYLENISGGNDRYKSNDYIIQKHNGLEIWNSFYRQTSGNMVQMDLVKQAVKGTFEKAFFELAKISGRLSNDEVLKFHVNFFENMFMQHANNIPCFKKVKEKSPDKMEFQRIVETHVNRFRKTFQFHVEKFQCNKTMNPSENMELTNELNKWFDDFNSKLNEFMALSKDLTLEQSMELHDTMVETIIRLHVENLECFKNLKTGAVDGMNLKDIITNHQKRCRNVFNMHVNMFNCE